MSASSYIYAHPSSVTSGLYHVIAKLNIIDLHIERKKNITKSYAFERGFDLVKISLVE